MKILNVSMSIDAALVGGLTSSFIRGFTISTKFDNGWTLFSTQAYFWIGAICSFFQFKSMNLGLDLFNEVQVIPIYETTLILMNIICGCIILDEKSMYSWSEIFMLFFYSIICIIGVMIIAHKPEINCKFKTEK